ncbi:hypothetical protein ACFPPA_09265 [Rhodanobacter ginsengisoli]|uniref:NIPSNAP family containing protein n=1 Tax=Rhodanobacter ginsengisoli TaxID=418646 RepID=A0ABW0QLV5_9GAMM
MKGISLCVVSALALVGVASVQAAEMEKANIMRVYTDSVAPPDQQAYEAGAKSFNKCLAEHGFKYAWTTWLHETGDTYQYSYVSEPVNWAAFDAMHVQSSPCMAAWQSDVNPHLKGETSAFLEIKPELSYMAKDNMDAGSPLMEVTFFKLKQGHEASEAFTAAAKKIAAAAAKSNWSSHYTFVQVMDADHGAPDFILSIYSKTWADFGKEPNQPLWKMVEGVYGKDSAAAMRKSVNGAIQEVWSHVDSRSADLTYTPAGK